MILYKKVVVFFLFVMMHFFQSQIKKIEPIIHIDNHKSLQIELKILFYSKSKNKNLFFQNPYISNLRTNGNSVIKIEDYKDGKKISIDSNIEFDNLDLLYDVDISKASNTRAYFSDENQIFILPDFNYFPINLNDTGTKKKIKFSNVHIIDKSNTYSYLYNDSSTNYNTPYLIAGNFEIFSIGKSKILIPQNINNYDKEKVKQIIGIIDDSYNYFEKKFGIIPISSGDNLFKIFFLNRDGGHGHNEGIILDQSLLNKENVLTNRYKALIAHEVAHYWWGNFVNSDNPSLIEGLAEYSAGLYMSDIEKFSSLKTYSKKNNELEVFSLDKTNFDTIRPINNENNIYKSFSYTKLPIILNDIEYTMGKDNFLNYLKIFFNKYKDSDTLVSYKDFIDGFDDNIKNELYDNIFNNDKKQWIDVFCKSIKGSKVEYQIENFSGNYIENIPVIVIDENGKKHIDNIKFINTLEITKEYNFNVKKVIIDPEFKINQLSCINDVFDTEKIDIFDTKYPQVYENKFYKFSNTLINYLFYGDKISLNSVSSNESEKLTKLVNTTRKITTRGFLLYIDKKEKRFKLLVSFDFSGKNTNGYISGKYIEQDNEIILDSLEKIKL